MKFTSIVSLVAGAAAVSASAIPAPALEKRLAGFPYECSNICALPGIIQGMAYAPGSYGPLCQVPNVPTRWFECPHVHNSLLYNGCTYSGTNPPVNTRSLEAAVEDIEKRSPEPQAASTWTCPNQTCAPRYCQLVSYYPTGVSDPAQLTACLIEQGCTPPA